MQGGRKQRSVGGGGGQELRLLCGFNQYTLLQNRDNSGLLGTPMFYSLKLGGGGGGGVAPAPPVEPPLLCLAHMIESQVWEGHR